MQQDSLITWHSQSSGAATWLYWYCCNTNLQLELILLDMIADLWVGISHFFSHVINNHFFTQAKRKIILVDLLPRLGICWQIKKLQRYQEMPMRYQEMPKDAQRCQWNCCCTLRKKKVLSSTFFLVLQPVTNTCRGLYSVPGRTKWYLEAPWETYWGKDDTPL